MNHREHESPLPEPLAYFITWVTYGTWLPGDARGWTEYRFGWRLPSLPRVLEAEARMTEAACVLDQAERIAVQGQIAETCNYRRWTLFAANCRSNHLHVVLNAPVHPKMVRSQLKAWCTQRLKQLQAESSDQQNKGVAAVAARTNWWAERGSQRYINDEDSLEAAIRYVRDGQDHGRFAGEARSRDTSPKR
jgi:REP element-mobilizing transposase RayT